LAQQIVTATDAEVLSTGPGSNAIVTADAAEIISSGPGSNAVLSTSAVEVLASVAEPPHNFVSTNAAEVITSGPGSNAVVTADAAEIITSGPGSSAVVSTNAVEVLSTVSAALHYFVSTEAAEIISSGPGSHADVTASAVEVLSTGDGSDAVLSTTAVEVLSSTDVYVARAIDGGRIYEFSFAFRPESMYQESDYDSIWGIGDRIGNGLITVNKDGWSSASNPGDLFNDNWGLAAGDGFGVGGSTGWPVGAFWSFSIKNNWAWVDGLKFHAGVGHALPGWYALLSGFDGEVWALDTGASFDEFNISITTADPEGGYQMELLFTPTIIPWNYFQITLAGSDGGSDYAGGDFGTELEIRLPHSILDGGDRRSTNGRPAKRVTMSASSGIVAVTGVGFDPFENLFDGKYFHSNSGTRSKTNGTQFKRVGGTGGDDAINTAGEYFQFAFPRKVFMREMVWCVSDGEALDGFGEPTRMGKWQWYGSNTSSSGYVALGDPFFFKPGSNWSLAPKVLEESQLPPLEVFGANAEYTGNSDDFSYPFFRMVLVEGYSAFGGGLNIAQIQFNLIDPAGQAPIMSLAFTDEADGLLPVVTIGAAGSPYVVGLTDGTDDSLTATVTITPNLLLTCAFTDAAGDGLNTWGSFYPTRFSQTMVIVKGR
jgi:hypothetical protein